MVTEQYVSFETARLLKEKGFDEKCFGFYNGKGEIDTTFGRWTNDDFIIKSYVAAPTQQMAMRWLREEKNIHIDIYWLSIRKQYHSEIIEGEKGSDDNFNTYEDAVEYALKYCLTKLL